MMKNILIKLLLVLVFIPSTLAQETTKQKSAGPAFEQVMYVAVPAKRLWSALVDPKIVAKYYLAPLAQLEKKKGGKIVYGTLEQPAIQGVIEEYTEGRKLAHTFSFGHRQGETPSLVTYEVTSMGDMSALRLTHTRFAPKSMAYVDIVGGWPIILSSLKTLLETGRTLPWPQPKKEG